MRPGAIQLAGPALGGIAVAVLQPWGSFALDAATFAFSAVCAPRIGATLSGPQREQASLCVRGVVEGLRYVRGQVWLWGTFVSATFTYFCSSGPPRCSCRTSCATPSTRVRRPTARCSRPAAWGPLPGAILLAGGHPQRPMIVDIRLVGLATLAVAGYGLATNAWGLAAAAVVVNGAEAVGAVVWATLKQRRVANSMLGRVSSIDWCISTALLPLSYALTAPIASILGPRQTLVLAGTLGPP